MRAGYIFDTQVTGKKTIFNHTDNVSAVRVLILDNDYINK